MADQRNEKRACVMIVEQSLDFGIKLADWLATHGYQAVLVRSVQRAIDECQDLNPQAVFIGLSPIEPNSTILRRFLHVIGATCPGISVITMGHRASDKTIHVVTSGGIRHVVIAPLDLAHIGRLLQAELNRTAASRMSSEAESDSADEWPAERLSPVGTVPKEAATWIG